MEDQATLIRNQMLETRTALSEKLEALEDKVVDTVKGTSESVTETVDAVKESIQETVDSVKDSVSQTVDSVKNSLDIVAHVRKRPWLMLGGAVVLGFVGGSLLTRRRVRRTARAVTSVAGSAASAASRPWTESASAPESVASPQREASGQGWLSLVARPLEPALEKVKGMAIGAVMGVLTQMVTQAAPDGLRDKIRETADTATRALGGEIIRDPLGQETAHAEASEPGTPRSFT